MILLFKNFGEKYDNIMDINLNLYKNVIFVFILIISGFWWKQNTHETLL